MTIDPEPELMLDRDFLLKRIKEQNVYLSRLPGRRLSSEMFLQYLEAAMFQKIRFVTQLNNLNTL